MKFFYKRPHRGWTTRIVIRYALIQLAGVAVVVFALILVQRWIPLPRWFGWAFVSFWIIKDIALFPFLWKAYDWDRAGETHAMIGAQGTAEETLNPSGYIRIRGELWRAELVEKGEIVEPGQGVIVSDMKGLTLFVQRKKERHENP